MTNELITKLKRKVWTRVFGKLSWTNRSGDFRAREQHGLISRPNYLYGMLRAADAAKYFGKDSVTIIEFGVASGAGLLNMVELAPMVESETGIKLRIVGFDTGQGLPAIQGYKDHPEIWRTGDFATDNREALVRKLGSRADIIWGDIAHTVGPFTHSLDASAPVGFISVDVDIYSATKSALQCLAGSPEKYNPAVSMYFDDVSSFFSNHWAGELSAICEFNEQNNLRKIDRDQSLPGRRPMLSANWYSKMYVCHVFDNEARQVLRSRQQLGIEDHARYMAAQHLF